MIDNSKELERWRADDGDNTLLLDHPLNNDSYVWEVGGYHGDWAIAINQKYGCWVDVYEPMTKNYDILKNRALCNIKLYCHNYGLSDHIEEGAPFASNEDSSRRYAYQSTETEGVILLDINDEIDDYDKIDLANINIEGMEYDILFRLLINDKITKIKRLQMQFHPWVKNAEIKRNIIRKWLSETHDEVYCYDWVWECHELKK